MAYAIIESVKNSDKTHPQETGEIEIPRKGPGRITRPRCRTYGRIQPPGARQGLKKGLSDCTSHGLQDNHTGLR